MHRDMQMANMVWSPYIFCDDYNTFTLQYRRGFLNRESAWYRNYLDGPLMGQQVPITRDEFDRYRNLGRELWGYVNIWGNFVPGSLQPYLPIVAPSCNNIDDMQRRMGAECISA